MKKASSGEKLLICHLKWNAYFYCQEKNNKIYLVCVIDFFQQEYFMLLLKNAETTTACIYFMVDRKRLSYEHTSLTFKKLLELKWEIFLFLMSIKVSFEALKRRTKFVRDAGSLNKIYYVKVFLSISLPPKRQERHEFEYFRVLRGKL